MIEQLKSDVFSFGFNPRLNINSNNSSDVYISTQVDKSYINRFTVLEKESKAFFNEFSSLYNKNFCKLHNILYELDKTTEKEGYSGDKTLNQELYTVIKTFYETDFSLQKDIIYGYDIEEGMTYTPLLFAINI